MTATDFKPAWARLKQMVANGPDNFTKETLTRVAALEIREEQVKQQELANLIAMLANPAACPFPSVDILARIKELTNIPRKA